MTIKTPSMAARIYAAVVGIVCILTGAYLAYQGFELIRLGGSPYYLPAGLAIVVSGYFLLRADVLAAYVFGLVYLVTIVWAVWEVGFSFWPLAARLGMLAVIGLLIALVTPALRGSERVRRIKPISWGLSGIIAVCLAAAFASAFSPIWLVKPTGEKLAVASDFDPKNEPANWVGFGRTTTGEQFAPYDQITRENVSQLKVAWTFHTGDITGNGRENQNTPLQIGNMIYACSPTNQIFAIEADTGKQVWHYSPGITDAASPGWMRCRSLAYYDVPASSDAATPTASPKRVYVTTADMRLIAVDADTGKPVDSFGDHGNVYLADGMGKVIPGFYNPTSGPLLAGKNLIVGGWVMDNQSTDEPSGVVRAFDAVTGKFAWAWDVGRPGQPNPPPAGQSYTRGTPNMWATPSYDAQLNMVYLPTGGATPDLYGGNRNPAAERVSQSVVALDATTGAEKWVFQLVHHDVFDYDLPSKPVLYDMPDGKGGRIPALVQANKNGQIYVLDRRTGKPITAVEEKPVPQDGLPGEHLSPTQPYSVGMPAMRDGVLTEASMWGITPIDELYCRVLFKSLKYEGDYTPPSTDWYLENPSWFGTTNWGGQSIDKIHDVMIVNDMRVAMKGKLLPRPAEEAATAASHKTTPGVGGVVPMTNTPYGAVRGMVQSFLGVPCTTPPFGTMGAIDMKTHKLLWQRSLGTPEQFGPLGMKTHMPIELGMPTLGGSVPTASGLIFFSATSDYYLRAMDVRTGEEVWKTPLPVGGGATPLVFKSPDTGKQYVVVTASGARDAPDHGDSIIAYALPDAAAK